MGFMAPMNKDAPGSSLFIGISMRRRIVFIWIGICWCIVFIGIRMRLCIVFIGIGMCRRTVFIAGAFLFIRRIHILMNTMRRRILIHMNTMRRLIHIPMNTMRRRIANTMNKDAPAHRKPGHPYSSAPWMSCFI